MTRFLVLICIILSINISCSSQEILLKDLKNSYSNLNAKFINQKLFLKDRELVFKNVNNKSIKDSLIFIEYFIDELGKYSCSVYSNGNMRCYEAIHDYGKFFIKSNIIETNLCGISEYIIESIKKGDINAAISKGKDCRFTPNTIIIITTAFFIDSKLIVNSYKTNKFRID